MDERLEHLWNVNNNKPALNLTGMYSGIQFVFHLIDGTDQFCQTGYRCAGSPDTVQRQRRASGITTADPVCHRRK